MKLVGFDLETTGTDAGSCGVVQVACATWEAYETCSVGEHRQTVADAVDMAETSQGVVLCNPGEPIPAGASAVHGIKDEDVGQAPHFAAFAPNVFAAVAGGVLVTFNGARFDVPVLERIAERKYAGPHVDVYRLHQLAKSSEGADAVTCPHVAGWPAAAFGGSLLAAHVFWVGEAFEGAHDALVDVRATLRTLVAMIEHGFVSLERAIELSSSPLPGDVDFDGFFRWQDGEAVFARGREKGTPLREVRKDYLRWMVNKAKGFNEDTLQIARAALRGNYPRKDRA